MVLLSGVYCACNNRWSLEMFIFWNSSSKSLQTKLKLSAKLLKMIRFCKKIVNYTSVWKISGEEFQILYVHLYKQQLLNKFLPTTFISAIRDVVISLILTEYEIIFRKNSDWRKTSNKRFFLFSSKITFNNMRVKLGKNWRYWKLSLPLNLKLNGFLSFLF